MSTTVAPLELERAAPRRTVLRSLRRPQIAIGVGVAAFWVVVMLTVQWWAPFDPYEAAGPRLQPPSTTFWMGTDTLGRDVFTRTMYGSRYSLPTAVAVILAAVVLGSALGALAGYRGGWIDSVIMRTTDIVLAFPPILLAMAVAAALGAGLRNTVLALIIVWWPVYARLLRAQVMSIKHREHVEAAMSVGVRRRRILSKHILPLAATPILVNATMDLGQVVLITASLSFLGLGATPPAPEWGVMIEEGAKNFYQWWIAVAPGLAIVSVVLGFNFLGDGLRDLLDPKARR